MGRELLAPRRIVKARTTAPPSYVSQAEEEEDVLITDVPAGATVSVETPQIQSTTLPARASIIPRGLALSSYRGGTISSTSKRKGTKRKRAVKRSNLKARLTKDLKAKRRTLEKEIRAIDADLKSIGAKRRRK